MSRATFPRPMEADASTGYILGVRMTPSGAALALPRQVRVVPREGKGLLDLSAVPADDEWMASARRAWAYARALVPDAQVDASVHVAGEAPLAGGSGAHALALLFLGTLLRVPLPPHFAVGHMETAHGFLSGGAMAEAKARAAADAARALGWPETLYFYPPTPRPVVVEAPLRGVRVLEPVHALRRLAPEAFARLRRRHEDLRFVGRHLPTAFTPTLPPVGPFCLLVPPEGDAPEGAQDVLLGRNALVVYRRRAAPGEEDALGDLARALFEAEAESVPAR